ncbi:hypothetical protein MLD38_015195 [Melastoma candidum]|uniref:Uncharacterized protein n=1 Tax=Melastoma candidum TaxID=119954 RepID=A0ACB9REK9_9MYRT|nr:hypothetical protein MLD38_015195 [Melastoma candidum]
MRTRFIRNEALGAAFQTPFKLGEDVKFSPSKTWQLTEGVRSSKCQHLWNIVIVVRCRSCVPGCCSCDFENRPPEDVGLFETLLKLNIFHDFFVQLTGFLRDISRRVVPLQTRKECRRS